MSNTFEIIIAIAVIVLNIIGIVWIGIKIEHFVLVPLGYIIALIIIGKINITACLVVALIVAAITLIVLIVKLVLLIVEIGGAANQNAKQGRLLKAIKQNDRAAVEKLITEGALVNGNYDGIDKFPLQVAVENCDEKMVALLIEKGANVTHYSKNGKPLVTAVKKGDKGIVSLLIEKGAKVNLGYDSKLPLDCAENEELTALLKSHGARTKKEQDEVDINFVNAVKYHDTVWVKSLLPQISDIDIIIPGYELVTVIATPKRGEGWKEVVMEDVREKVTPLMYAVSIDDIEMVKLLAENGASIHERDSYGRNAVVYAVLAGNPAMIDFLASKGAYVNNAYFTGMTTGITALLLAVSAGNIAVVEALIRNGADVNAKSTSLFDEHEHITVLSVAEYKGYTEIAALLRKSGARG